MVQHLYLMLPFSFHDCLGGASFSGSPQKSGCFGWLLSRIARADPPV